MERHWKATHTAAADKRNIFSIESESQAHLATVISGNRSRQDEFERFVSLIEAVPEMLAALEHAKKTLDDLSFLENPALRATRRRLDDLSRRLPSF
jgi:hypothetical protein